MLRPLTHQQVFRVVRERARIAVLALATLCLAAPGDGSTEPVRGKDMMQTTSIGPAGNAGRTSEGPEPLAFGVYDPHNRFRDSNHTRIEHVFVSWHPLDKRMLDAKMRLAQKMGRTLMVTVEPHPKAANWHNDGKRLFADIADGRFNAEIAATCGMIARFPGEQWIRWGHEMETPSDRYAWAGADPRGYVAAYRNFVDACRKIAPRARFVWSPKGERGLEAYYPGGAHVDFVGLSLWGLEKWDRNWHGRPRGFAETLRERYRRVERFGKPVIVAELGVAGREAYRHAWVSEIMKIQAGSTAFPLLKAIVYFNDKEPHYWPNGYGSPDWRLPLSVLADARPSTVPSR